MRNKLFVLVALNTLMLGLVSCKEEANSVQQAPELETLEQKVSYTLGYYLSRELQSGGMSVDLAATLKAIDDVRDANALMLSKEEMRAAALAFQDQQRELSTQEARQESSKAGDLYLAENAKREGVSVSDSGLQYEILRSAEGPNPKPADTLTVHYSGELINGTVFDSSVEAGEPVSFTLGDVIPGWQEALAMMKVGEKWRVSLPPALAYPNGTRDIPPGSVLIYELELLDINAE